MPPDKRSGPEGPPRSAAAKQANAKIIADRQRQARERVRAMLARRRTCSELEQLASLVTYYRGHLLRGVPSAQLLDEGRWAP